MSKNKRRIPLPEPETEAETTPLPEEVSPQEEDEKTDGAGETEETPSEKASSLSERLKRFLSSLPAQKTRRIAGFLCLFVSVFLSLAFLSHLFYWWIDYDVVQQMRSGNIWAANQWQVRNICGPLGAYVAVFFINYGFGIASFIFPVLLFMGGLQSLKLKRFSWLKIIFRSVFGLLWISVLCGWIFGSGRLYVFGGSAGLYTSRYLHGLIGAIGLGLILAFTCICYLIINYNLRGIHLSFRQRKKRPVEEHELHINYPETHEQPVIPKPEEPEDDDNPFGLTLSERLKGTDTPVENENPPGSPVIPSTPGKTIIPLEPEVNDDLDVKPSTPQEPIEENPSLEEPVHTDIPAADGEMTIVDTRAQSENTSKATLPPVQHFGIDTPFDPRLDLSGYQFPTLDLLEDFGDQSQKIQDMTAELQSNKNRIVETLQNYGISISSISATIGPTVTLYEIVPAPGIRISKIKNLEDDIALSLSALGIRIIAPIPGKGTIGIEVPNSKKQVVPMRDMLTCDKFKNKDLALPIAIGKTISNEAFVADLAKMPHLLVAGATGQGKSVGLNAIIASLLYSRHPAELKFVMVDPKKVELSLYSKIERHYLAKLPDSEEAIITDTRKVVRTLNSLCMEMDNRYDLLKDAGAKNIKEYNKKIIDRRLVIDQAIDPKGENKHHFLPYIVLVIDEFADLIMTAGREVEQPIARLAQLARAIGIHLVIATQRPSVNIITGLIKANFPARIAFKVSQKIDSRTILDAGGADQLIGRGDMLISMGEGLIRLQCAFIDTPEIERITEFIGSQRAYPDAYLLPDCPDENGGEGGKADIESGEWDSMFREAAELVVSTQQGSTSMLQRKFKLGYNRAGRIMDQLETAGIVGAFDGRKTREVKIKDPETLERLLQSLNL